MIGFGRSSRPSFISDEESPEDAEKYFMKYISAWIDSLKLDFFILCGHSLGAYLSCVYMIQSKNPKCLHLILADPWGFPKKT